MQLLVCFIIAAILWQGLSGSNESNRIAVCIGGQLPRLQPHLMSPLFAANPKYHFTLFYSLQYSVNASETKFWSDKQFVFDPAPVGALNRSLVKQALLSTYKPHNDVNIGSVRFGLGLSAKKWSEMYFNGGALSVIRLPAAVPEIVLNMLSKQTDCAEQIVHYEQSTSVQFNYVFWGREDLHFFKPFDLHNLTAYLGNQSATSTGSSPSDQVVTKQSNTSENCQLLVRNCLTHGGLPLRGYIWTRDIAIPTMLNRMKYYSQLLRRNESVVTVEAFEYHLMLHRNISVCFVNKDYFPTVAVRHTVNGRFCIPPMEVGKRCYPTGFDRYVSHHKCRKSTLRLVQNYRYTYNNDTV